MVEQWSQVQWFVTTTGLMPCTEPNPGAYFTRSWGCRWDDEQTSEDVEQLPGINVESNPCQLRRSTRLKLLYGAFKGYEISYCPPPILRTQSVRLNLTHNLWQSKCSKQGLEFPGQFQPTVTFNEIRYRRSLITGALYFTLYSIPDPCPTPSWKPLFLQG